MGPINIALTGRMMAAALCFQTLGESYPVLTIASGGFGKPRRPVEPKREVVIKRKTNEPIIKKATNFLLDIPTKTQIPMR